MNKPLYLIISALLLFSTIASAREYHVSVSGDDNNDGSAVKPFRTIS